MTRRVCHEVPPSWVEPFGVPVEAGERDGHALFAAAPEPVQKPDLLALVQAIEDRPRLALGSRIGGGSKILFLGSKMEDRAVLTDPCDSQGGRLGSGISSPRRRTGQTVSARTTRGSVFRPLSTPGEGLDPSIQAIGAGSSIVFLGSKMEDRAARSTSPVPRMGSSWICVTTWSRHRPASPAIR
jgi:hypothetical protein